MSYLNRSQALRKLYYDPSSGFQSQRRLHRKANSSTTSPQVTHKDVQQFLNKQLVYQRFARPRNKDLYPITAPSHSYQADLMFFPHAKHINNGYNTVLTIIEVTTRMGFAIPMKNKTTSEVMRAFESVFQSSSSSTPIANLVTD